MYESLDELLDGLLDELLSASRNGDDTKMQQLLLNCDYKQAIARSAFFWTL